jgi:hypothetical protein
MGVGGRWGWEGKLSGSGGSGVDFSKTKTGGVTPRPTVGHTVVVSQAVHVYGRTYGRGVTGRESRCHRNRRSRWYTEERHRRAPTPADCASRATSASLLTHVPIGSHVCCSGVISF